MTHDCYGGKEEVSTQGWSARFFEKIGTSVSVYHSIPANGEGI